MTIFFRVVLLSLIPRSVFRDVLVDVPHPLLLPLLPRCLSLRFVSSKPPARPPNPLHPRILVSVVMTDYTTRELIPNKQQATLYQHHIIIPH